MSGKGKVAKAVPAKNSLKAQATKRRQVYRPILETPYTTVEWPRLESSKLTNLLELFIRALKVIKEDPALLSQITTGFNSTMKVLEERKKVESAKQVAMVFVCKAEVKPQLLIQHLPELTAVASTAGAPVKLIQLPNGSSQKISDALGIKNTWIVSLPRFATDSTELQVLQDFVFGNVDSVSVPWLEDNVQFAKTNVKFVATTQPVIAKNNQKKKKL